MRVFVLGLLLVLAACGTDEGGSKQPLNINTSLPPAYVGDPYNATFTADGGVQPYTFKLEGSLPKGITFNRTGLSGIPQEKGSYKLRLIIEDANLSKTFKDLTLLVSDPPPPKLTLVQPQSEVSQPFILLARLEGRESRGFQAQIPLKDFKPVLESLQAQPGVFYVARYNPEREVMDLDVAFAQPKRDLEVLRLTVSPTKALRPALQPRVAYYDKEAKPFPGNPSLERVASEGKYTYADLLTLAQNFGKKAAQPANPQTPGTQTPQPPATQPATPPAQTSPATTPPPAQNQGQTQPPATNPATPPQPNPEQTQQPATATPPQQAAQTPPTTTPPQPPEIGQAQQTNPTPPAQAQPAPPSQPQPGPTQPQQPAPAPKTGLPGDFNEDGVVDQKDLDLLRSSYRWSNVGNPAPANPPAQPQQPGQTPPNPPAQPGNGNTGGQNNSSSGNSSGNNGK
ncbi:MAG TPA: Ig domain-containing protein [Meiothermus sp.]|nr:Ig domain-containing protein [Meiothermus sp.]